MQKIILIAVFSFLSNSLIAQVDDDFFSEKPNNLNPDMALEKVKRAQLEQDLKKAEENKKRKIRKMSKLCPSSSGLVFWRRNSHDPWYKQQPYHDVSQCRNGYKGYSKRRIRRECIAWVRQRQRKKKLCQQWRRNFKNGKIENSDIEAQIKRVNLDIQAAYEAEQVAAKKLKQTQANDLYRRKIEQQNKKKQQAQTLRDTKEKRILAALKRCKAAWQKKQNPCGCRSFGSRVIPAWVLKAKTCSQ